MTVENDMNQWPKYDHLFLPELTEVGQMLISRIFNYMRVYQLSGGGISYKGHVLNVEQDLSMLVNQLPLLPHEIPCFIIRRKNATSPNGYRDFKVNRNHIMLWLKFLKVNNPFYADINLEAAEERASLLPEDGLIACSIRDMEEEDEDFSDDEEDNNDSQHQSSQNNNANYDPANIENEHLNDFNQSEIRPETGGASGEPDPSLVIEQVTNIPINQQDQQNTTTNTSNEFLDDLPALVDRHAQTLHENFPHARPPMNDPTSVLWPEPGAFVNDFSEVGLCSKAFPTLFPYGKGDPSCKDRSHEVSLDKAGKHFLKYCVNLKEAQEELRKKYGDSKEEEINAIFDSSSNNSPFVYPFVQNNRFVRFIQNTVERHRANDQRTTWISSNSKFSSLSSDEIGDVINTGGEPLKGFLSSMQCYNANINGSPQYLFKKRKLLETLIDQKGMCSMWFTLSMADNHWTDLFAMMTRDSGGKVTEMPTFNSVQEEASWKQKMVRENPHLVDAYFYDCVNTLIEEVFGKNGIEIEWVWYRIEYQSRDAPHVHGCLRFKRDPGILEHSQNVQMGREAARILRAAGLLNESDDFDPSVIEDNTYSEPPAAVDLENPDVVAELRKKIERAKESHCVIVAFHDFLITTMNSSVSLPVDAKKDVRDSSTIFNPRTTTIHHPSAIDPLPLLNNSAAIDNLYCRSCNVQSRHKHQAYCDKNHDKREEAKHKLANGMLGPREKRPEDICVRCRFNYEKPICNETHVQINQMSTGKGESRKVTTRLSLITERNDCWMNSHMRSIMEVSVNFILYTSTSM